MTADITPDHLKIVKNILRAHLPTCAKAWVFGSRATGGAKKYSDLDLAISSADGSKFSLDTMAKINYDFEQSLLPYKVDILDINAIQNSFRNIIEKDKIALSLGLFITLEGGDGAGKTTQSKALDRALKAKGFDVITTREPGGTPEGEELRNLIVNNKKMRWSPMAETLLLFTARLTHVEQVILPAIENGKIVVCDRFTDSTLAYQGYAGGQDLEEIKALEQLVLGDFSPDITFVMDLPTHVSRASGGDRFEDRDSEFQQSLRDGYLEIAKNNPNRCILINALQEKQDISNEILTFVMKKLDK